jgi:hypothetical protein
MSCELSQRVKQVEKTGMASRIRCDSEVRPVAENLPGQICQHITRPDFDEDAGTPVIHGLHLIGKLHRADQVLG